MIVVSQEMGFVREVADTVVLMDGVGPWRPARRAEYGLPESSSLSDWGYTA